VSSTKSNRENGMDAMICVERHININWVEPGEWLNNNLSLSKLKNAVNEMMKKEILNIIAMIVCAESISIQENFTGRGCLSANLITTEHSSLS